MSIFLTLSLAVNAQAEDIFVPCRRLGGIRECVAVPLTDSKIDKAAKTFEPPAEGKSRTYIVRPYTTEPKKKSEVFVDGQLAAHIAPAIYVVLTVSLGQHHIKVQTEHSTEIQVNVAPGELRHLKYQLNLLFNTVTGELAVLGEKSGHHTC
jgi:hypothetical protein